jgi:L-asparaginase
MPDPAVAAPSGLRRPSEAAVGRPRVDCLATGGTIASVTDAQDPGAAPTLSVAAIVASVAGIEEVANLRTAQLMQRASPSITFADLLTLREEIASRVADGASGVAVVQGTDTIEETAFALDLLWDGEAPVVITGAMRGPSLPGADGPANLLAAVQVAASAEARRLGALVVFGDEIHTARYVTKAHTSRLAAFRSRAIGPVGWLTEGRPVIATRPTRRFHLDPPAETPLPPVALVRVALDDDGRILPTLPSLGFAGAVIEGFGGGHVTPPMVAPLERLAAELPVVLASRTSSGELLTSTYRYPGSEIELLELGLIRAGALDGLKARILLSLCLGAKLSRQQIASAFEALDTESDPVAQRPELSVVTDGSSGK